MAKNKRQKARFIADGQSYFIILLILSIWLNFIFPIRAILYAPYTYFGIIIIGFGIAIGLWSRSLFLKSKTTLSPYESPTSLVTSGPFHISRNPMYLGMAAILLGIAIFLGTLVTFTFPALFSSYACLRRELSLQPIQPLYCYCSTFLVSIPHNTHHDSRQV